MHDYDLQTTLDDLSRTFDDYKKANEERLSLLEKKGKEDPLLQEKMARLDSHMEKAEKRLRHMEAFQKRPSYDIQTEPTPEHTVAFMDYVRKGADASLQDYEKKSLTTTADRDGGYLVPPGLQQNLYGTLQSISVMRSLASLREISTSALEMLIDKDTADAGWVAEEEARPETKTPELAKIRIPVHEMYARPRATQKLLDDAFLNVEEWLAQKIGHKMATMENQAFISGDGNNKPKGLLSYETVDQNKWEWGKLEELKSGVNGDFGKDNGADTLLILFHSLKSNYLTGASWLMSRTAQSRLRQLKDPGNHQYLWQPPLGGTTTATLLGYPVVISDDMPTLTADTPSKGIVFGNFKEGYQIVDRQGVRVLRDPYSSKPYVEFYTTRRVGGDVVNFEALKVLNFAA